MKLKTIYPTAEDIPEGYADLYTERNGQWELTGIEGVKTQADVERVQEALRKEKSDHKATKAALVPFEGLDPEAISAQQTRLEEVTAQLEAINKDGRIDETKLEPIIAARLKQAVGPLEREKASLEKQIDAHKKALAEKDGEVFTLKTSITTDSIERTVREAAVAEKVQSVALDDVIGRASRIFEKSDDGRVITKDVNGVTPGLSPKEWLKDMMEKAPHWWPASVGGNSGGPIGKLGSRTNNPWSKANWSLTAQGAVVREVGMEKAAAIAAQVGSKIGDTKPAAA